MLCFVKLQHITILLGDRDTHMNVPSLYEICMAPYSLHFGTSWILKTVLL